jgi:ATP-dependent Clp protease ATP-binding subunit ClpA
MQCRRVFRDIHSKVSQLGHSSLDTLHLLHGLLSVETAGAGEILGHLLGKLGTMRSELAALLSALPGEPKKLVGPRRDQQTPAFKQAVEHALAAAEEAKAERLRTEHLLIGLTSLRDDRAAGFLRERRVTPEAVRDHLWVIRTMESRLTSLGDATW